jgi:hypothetical protein
MFFVCKELFYLFQLAFFPLFSGLTVRMKGFKENYADFKKNKINEKKKSLREVEKSLSGIGEMKTLEKILEYKLKQIKDQIDETKKQLRQEESLLELPRIPENFPAYPVFD